VIEKLGLVIVPMVGGDNQKNRIGYGKGFYDRFLKQVDCPTVGLLFNECLVQKIPVEPFDVSLGKIITEDQIIE
jgi:5-formyltetrahydrofolate cyclo-ligase